MSTERVYLRVLKNNFKEKDGKNAPDYRLYVKRGKDGELERVGSLWVNESEAGNTYFSGSVDEGVAITGTTAPKKTSGFPKPNKKKAFDKKVPF